MLCRKTAYIDTSSSQQITPSYHTCWVLGLPYAFRTAGRRALGVAGAGAATFYCMLLLLECRDKLREQEETSSEDGQGQQPQPRCRGERCFGRIGRHITEATIILSQTGGTVAYLVFIGQNVSSVFATADVTPSTVVLALLLPIQALLSLVRSLSSLGQFSILADACTVLAVATVVKQDLQLLLAALVALSAIACFVPAFGSFVGSTVCALLSFVLPALFHLRVVGRDAGAAQRALDWAILLFGLAFAAHGLYDAVLSPPH